MLATIQHLLNDKNIPNEIKIRTKNIYGIYKRLNEGHRLSDIHDLLALKIMVDEVENCYRTLGIIHSEYHPVNNKFKDYICNPKTNMYQSLHTTVFGLDGRLVQTQIRTFKMDKIASFGLTAYWDAEKGKTRDIKGDIIELPKGATPIDFAYKLNTDIGNTMVGVFVNDEYVPIDYILQNKDRIRIVTDDLSYGPRDDWMEKTHTSYAKQKIRDFNRK